MSKTVIKKILPEYFGAVNARIKNFEIRKDEDDLQVGDILILKEWNGQDYTGRGIRRRIKYILRNVPEYGLKEGYCVVGW